MRAPRVQRRLSPGLRGLWSAMAACAALSAAGCATGGGVTSDSTNSGVAGTTTRSATPQLSGSPAPLGSGTVVRFSRGTTSVEVDIDSDTPAARDFVSMLPLELTVEEFAGTEKIAYLPRRLNRSDTAGSDPSDGDLIYYAPWGNLGFYYDATGVGFSDDTLHLGRFRADVAELTRLEGGPVRVTLHERGTR